MKLPLLSLATLLALGALSSIAADREPVRLIFDTDMGNDVDDALALGMIHALQSRGECRLLAVTVTKDHELCAPYIDAVNTFYGRPDIPIGVVHNGPTPGDSKFLPLARAEDNGRPRYPHDLENGGVAPEAVALLREILAAQPDGSVVIAQVGFSTNLGRLLNSRPDVYSLLDGMELVQKKVKLLSIMAGAFEPIQGRRHLEYNVIKDIPNHRQLAEAWPTEIVYSGFEIGIALRYPAVSIERDYAYVPHHPLAESYILYNPPPHERPTWDLTSVLYAVYPDREYFGLSEPGRVVVEDDGFTQFEPDPEGRIRYLTLTADQITRTREALVQLSSQPPSPDPKR